MTSGRHTSSSLSPAGFPETLNVGAAFRFDAPRAGALRALLRLNGAIQTGDPSLARLTDADLALLHETLDLLGRTDAAPTA